MASAGLRRIVCVPPRVAREPGIPARSNFAAIGKSSDREYSKRGIWLTSGARTNPSQGQLDCAGANIDARLSRRGSGVWFNRRDSKSREPLWLRGFESPPLRQTVCSSCLQFGDRGKSARTWRFCARCEPEKAISVQIRIIPWVFSPREEKTG